MDFINIRYQLSFADKQEQFDFRIHSETYELLEDKESNAPEWAKLEHHKCSHCPLNKEEHPYCPLALHLNDVVDRLHDTTSIDQVEMELATGNRRVIESTTMQNAVGSMLEIIYPASGCPKTRLMRPQARFYVPAGSEAENVYRITGMYLLAQYFRQKTNKSGSFDFEELIEFYSDLNILNKSIAGRLKGTTQSDSVKNAITLMDMYSTLIPLMLEDELVELRDLFKDFLPQETVAHTPVAKSNYLERIKNARLELEPILEEEEEEEQDEEPEWLRMIRGKKAPEKKPPVESAAAKAAEAQKQAVEKILQGSKLSLALEPTDEEADKPTTGKAKFTLDD